MAFVDGQPFTLASGAGFVISNADREPDPWDASAWSWTEVENSTAADWGGFYITFVNNDTKKGLFQVATGAASSETIIATVPMRWMGSTLAQVYYVPIPIPSGTRVSVRASANGTQTSFGQIIGVLSSQFASTPSFSVLESGPYNLENSSDYGLSAFTVDPGGTANTKSAYAEISGSGTNYANNVLDGSSLPEAYDYLGLIFGDNVVGNQVSQDRLWDVAYGAASSETNFMENIHEHITDAEIGSLSSSPIWLPWGRAAGDRLSARLQSSVISTPDRIGSIFLLGLR